MQGHRGRVPVNNHPEQGDERCTWGSCEAGGWILKGSKSEVGDNGIAKYHPGCRKAMEYANRPQLIAGSGAEKCRAPGADPNRCSYGDCVEVCRYVVTATTVNANGR